MSSAALAVLRVKVLVGHCRQYRAALRGVQWWPSGPPGRPRRAFRKLTPAANSWFNLSLFGDHLKVALSLTLHSSPNSHYIRQWVAQGCRVLTTHLIDFIEVIYITADMGTMLRQR